MVRSGQHSSKIIFLDIASSLPQDMMFSFIFLTLFCSLSFHSFPLFALKLNVFKKLLIQLSKIAENQPSYLSSTWFL